MNGLSVKRGVWIAAGALALLGCPKGEVTEPSPPAEPELTVTKVDLPAPEGARFPNVLVRGEKVWISWLEPGAEDEWTLQVVSGIPDALSTPVTIARGADLMVNWADFPVLGSAADGTLFASWLQKLEGSKYAYGIRLARSSDDGQTWSDLGLAHDDGTPTEHGFVSMAPDPKDDDSIRLFWLDGRLTADKGPMTLRTGRATDAVRESRVLDERVCDCCGTSAVATDAGVVVAYRDRSEEEVRDIVVERLADEGSQAVEVASDGWKIPGCPVNGPALDALDATTVLAWFTAAKETGRVRVAFSENGESFGTPLEIAVDTRDEHVLGQVDVALVTPTTAYVTWLTSTNEQTHLRIRRVQPGGNMTEPRAIAVVAPRREAGFPRLARVGSELLLVWTTPAGVEAALLHPE